ncbi:hypothetical protein N7528_007811 [Penicillium herquei]|nr:hypothetical protein N7528_007811 [Penicillium herquei]
MSAPRLRPFCGDKDPGSALLHSSIPRLRESVQYEGGVAELWGLSLATNQPCSKVIDIEERDSETPGVDGLILLIITNPDVDLSPKM